MATCSVAGRGEAPRHLLENMRRRVCNGRRRARREAINGGANLELLTVDVEDTQGASWKPRMLGRLAGHGAGRPVASVSNPHSGAR
jgi:hypothetical protein